MNEKRWSKHIINKFGISNALLFVDSRSICPCVVSSWMCVTCKYYNIKINACKKGRAFYHQKRHNPKMISKIKKLIKKELEKRKYNER